MIKPYRFIFRIVIFISLVFPWGVDPLGARTVPEPQAFLPETHFEFPSVFEGQEVYHEFVIRNKGDAPLDIRDVRTG